MTFNANIPNATDLLSQSQVTLKANNIALNTSFGRNHVPFSTATNNGKHTFIEMPVSAGIPAPGPGLISGEGTLYTNTISSASELLYTPDASGNIYQITNTKVAKYAQFGTMTNYTGSIFGGWTFLPGGLILNYGFLASPTSNQTITFARPYDSSLQASDLYITLTTRRVSTTAGKEVSVESGSITATNFRIAVQSSDVNGVWWQVIGK